MSSVNIFMRHLNTSALKRVICTMISVTLGCVSYVYGDEPPQNILRRSAISDDLIHDHWRITKSLELDRSGISQITAMAAAPYRELWLGTPSGLARYDGLEFRWAHLKPSSKTPHSLPLLNVTTLSNISASSDLYVGVQSQGVWRYHDQNHGELESISGPKSRYSTPFATLAVDHSLYVGGTHGLSIIGEDQSSTQERLIASDTVFDLARLGSAMAGDILVCGANGISLLKYYSHEFKLIFSRTKDDKSCRGLVSYSMPQKPKTGSGDGAFILFEDQLYLLEDHNIYHLETPPINASWRQKPYLDKVGKLWVPTQDYLYQFDHYTAVRSRGLLGERIEPLARFDISNIQNLYEHHQSAPSSLPSVWISTKKQRLLKLSKRQGQLLLPRRNQSSGGGPVLRTRSGKREQLWWVESCENLFSAIYQDDHTQSPFSQVSKLNLPKRVDGECIDSLGGGEVENSPILVARRNEVFALHPEGKGGKQLKLLKTWDRTCESLDCRITTLHLHSLSPLIVFAGTQSGHLLRLHASGQVEEVNVLTTKRHSAITVIRSSQYGLLIGHENGVNLLEFDKDFKVIEEVTLGAISTISIPKAPIRDLLYDNENHVWWIASYGDGLGWLDLNKLDQPRGGQIREVINQHNRFLSGLIIPKFNGSQVDRELWVQSNQGIIRLNLGHLFAISRDKFSKKLRADDQSTVIDVNEANGWLRPSFTQIGPFVVAATTEQTEIVDTRILAPSQLHTPPHFVEATWRGDQLAKSHELTSDQLSLIEEEQVPTLIAPSGASELVLRLAHELGVDQPDQVLLYKLSISDQKHNTPWVSLGQTKHLRFLHLRPGEYILELKAQNHFKEASEIRRLKLILPLSLDASNAPWFWSVLFFSLGSSLLLSSLFYRQTRSLKIQAKTYEFESQKAKSYLEHYRQVFNRSDSAFFLFSEQMKCLEWNPRALELFQLTSKEMRHVSPQALGFTLPSPHHVTEDHRDLPLLCQRPFGESFPARVSLSQHLINKEKSAILVSVVDLSTLVKNQDERLKAQEDLSQARRLESLGRLAGWVAHEINNTFGEVEGVLESIEEQIKHARTPVVLLSKLKQITHRGHRRVQRLLNLTHDRHYQRQHSAHNQSQTGDQFWCSVDQLFNSDLGHLSWMLTQSQSLEIKVVTEPIEDDDILGRAFDASSSSEMEDVDLNVDQLLYEPQLLRVNKSAFDHFLFRLVLLLSERAPSNVHLQAQLGLTRGKTLLFKVRLSSGFYLNQPSHLPWERQQKALSDQLLILSEQLSELGGTLTQTYEPKFTEVSLKFPVFEHVMAHDLIETLDDVELIKTTAMLTEEAEEGSLAKPPQPPSVLAPHIILVDDNEMLLTILVTRFERSGFVVDAFTDAREAIRFADQTTHSIQALVTDVLMPHINGRHLAMRLRRSYPQLPIVFISAYTDDILSSDGIFSLEEGEYFMRKPFSPRQLISLIFEVMDAKIPVGPVHEREPLG